MLKKSVSILSLLLAALAPLLATEFHVSPSGSPSGNGSASQPWDLQTALNQPAAVKPGDTLWLRGGVHRRSNRPTKFISTLSGASNLPITVRQYPGERATIDGNIFQATGGWVNYWGFEIMNSYPTRLTAEAGSFPTAFTMNYDGALVDMTVSGFDLRAPNVKLINLIIHDSIGGGIGVGTVATNPEIYGNLSFYNGWQGSDRGHGHGLYAQSSDPSVPKFQENLFFANYALGAQAYASSGHVDNVYLEGNAFFANGTLALQHQQNLVIGPWAGSAKDPVLIRNFVYDAHGTGADTYIGYIGGARNPVLRSNYFQTSVQFSANNLNQTLTGNTFLGGTINLLQGSYANNTYLATLPTANLVEVRPNKYEPGRAHIIVYNWQHLSSVLADVSGVLPLGTAFEVRNVQDYFGAPLLTGTYAGGVLELPMTGLSVAKPVATDAPTPPSTAPAFNVFVLMPVARGIVAGQPPVLSPIGNQVTTQDTPTAPITFTVTDADTPVTDLSLWVTSSNPALAPALSMFLSGNVTSRTLTITPALAQSGAAIITVFASDGIQTSSTSFLLTVIPANQPPAISAIADVAIAASTQTPPLAFTVADPETPAGSLTLLGASSNPTLLPNANIVFGGSGANRTVTLTPAFGQTGTATIRIAVSDGATTVLRSFGLTVTSNTPAQLINLPFWAQAATVVAPMALQADSQSPSTVYATSPTAQQGTVAFMANITAPGTYVIWCRVLAQNGASDSFYVSVDGGAEDIYDAAEGAWTNAWQWTRVNGRAGGAPATLNPRTFTFSQGTHSVVFRSREAGTGLDRIVISNDPNFVPTDADPATISAIADTTVLANTSTSPLAFTIANATIPPPDWVLSARSSNPTLVPDANIIFGGSGSNRTVTATPAANQTGTATITIDAMNGGTVARGSVVLTVISSVNLPFEAEAGVVTAPMTVLADPGNPNRRYVATATKYQGSVSFQVQVPVSGAYIVWCQVLAKDPASDSFFVSVDGAGEDIFDTAEGTWSSAWQWTPVNGRTYTSSLPLKARTFNLSAGTHTILFRGRETNAGLDKIIVTSDLGFVPQ